MSTLHSAMTASASALSAERARIEVAVSNMANAESTRGANGQPYRRRDVVLASDPVETFDDVMGRTGAVGVKVADIVEDQAPFARRYDPAHPDADAEGFVRDAQCGRARADGRHAVRHPRVSGEPDRHRPDQAT